MAARRSFWIGSALLPVLLAGAILAVTESPDSKAGFSPCVTRDGTIRLPADYAERWTHLGAWVVTDPQAPGYGLHNVYTQPETVRAFRKTGKFPDGAVLVKEIRKPQTGELTTGKAVWAGEPALWFVMVKETRGRFPGHPNWGDGWGWAMFEANSPQKNASTDYRKDCVSCHQPAKERDWIYTEGYPVLR